VRRRSAHRSLLPSELIGFDRLRGYTVIELVLVIALLAILSAVAAPRFFDNTAFDERAYADELAGSLRYAQKVAVASGCRVRADIAAASYSLTQQTPQGGHCDPSDASFPLQVQLSTGEVMSGSAPAGVTTAPAVSVVFDALGRTNFAANQTLTVGSHAILIQADSGLVTTP
jgi:MSHA pilin protein MshC